MPRVDRRGDDAGPGLAEQRRGEGDERRDADHRNVERQTHRPRHGEADANAGEGAGTGRDRDAVERRKSALDAAHDPFDQRRQRFGVAARHRLAGAAIASAPPLSATRPKPPRRKRRSPECACPFPNPR